MSIKKLTAFAGAIVLGACASAPEDIPPAYVSEAAYAGWTCEQLAKESAQLSAALATASKQQEDARTGDTVGVIFLGLPVSSMTGGNVAPEVARLKGHTDAVKQAMIKQNCGPTTPRQTVEQRRAEIKANGMPKSPNSRGRIVSATARLLPVIPSARRRRPAMPN